MLLVWNYSDIYIENYNNIENIYDFTNSWLGV